MTVTAALVKELRERTGAGMTDCKKALDETKGSIDAAINLLREKGLAAAAKKSGRAASEGVVAAIVTDSNRKGYLVEVNCETDFVTRNEEFQQFVVDIQKTIEKSHPTSLESLVGSALPNGAKVSDTVTNLVAKIGENIQVRRFANAGDGKVFVTSYVHGGGKVGVLVELFAEGIDAHRAKTELNEVAKDVALQVAAMKPICVSRDSIPEETKKTEYDVYYNQYKNQGKPEAMLPKIVAGRMETWFKEVCLAEQPFVKDDSKTISAYVSEVGKAIGLPALKVVNFTRFELGQGVEKKSADFAAEVAAQIASSQQH